MKQLLLELLCLCLGEDWREKDDLTTGLALRSENNPELRSSVLVPAGDLARSGRQVIPDSPR